MYLRRMIILLGIVSGCVTFILTLWRALSAWELDLLQASVRAIAAGGAVILFSLLLQGIIIKIGGPDQGSDHRQLPKKSERS